MNNQVASLRMGDASTWKTVVMVAEALLQNLGVFTPRRGEVLQYEWPELAVGDPVPGTEVVAGHRIPFQAARIRPR